MNLNNSEFTTTIDKIKLILRGKNLASELEVIIKHLPTYNKIIKTHILQLKNVLALDNHKNKNLDNINLSSTVKQLIDIFDKLEENDLQKLEELLVAANNWKIENTNYNSQTITSTEAAV